MDERLKIYGFRLRCLRENLGLSRTTMSAVSGIPDSNIKRWELGQCDIGFNSLIGYLNKFKECGVNISLDAFANLDEPLEYNFSKKIK